MRFALTALLLCIAAPLRAQPDLTVSYDLFDTDTDVEQGTNIQLSVRICNVSATSAVDDPEVTFFLSEDDVLDPTDLRLGDDDGIDDLQPGECEETADQQRIGRLVVPGSYVVIASVDHENEIDESDETNNTASVDVTVQPGGVQGPDWRLDLPPSNDYLFAPIGVPYSFRVRVCNDGYTVIPDSVELEMWFQLDWPVLFDNTRVVELGRQTLPGVVPGDCEEVTAVITIPEGTPDDSYLAYGLLDPDDEDPEPDEEDNRDLWRLQGGNGRQNVDYITRFVPEQTPATARVGETIVVGVNICNIGTQDGYWTSAEVGVRRADTAVFIYDFLSTTRGVRLAAGACQRGEVTLVLDSPLLVPGDFILSTDGFGVYWWEEGGPYNNDREEVPLTILPPGNPLAGEEADAFTDALEAVAPNPLRQSGRVAWTTEAPGSVRLELFDALGRRVAILADGVRPGGANEVRLDAARLPPGAYILVLTTERERLTRPLTIVR